jgi:predicted acyltransferase (DUF342 family)
MRQWLAESEPNGVAAENAAISSSRITPGGEEVLVLPGGRLRGEPADKIVFSKGDLIITQGSIISREIFCEGSLACEERVQLQSAAADGTLELGEASEVARWVDANGKIVIRSGALVRSRASSLTVIELEQNVRVQSLYAPMMFSGRLSDVIDAQTADEASAPVAPSDGMAHEKPPPYLSGSRCTRLAPGTWLVQANVNLPARTLVDENLIVKGTLVSQSDCAFLRDVKAAELRLGPRNQVQGNLTAEGSVLIGEGSTIERNIAAGADVRLASRSRVGRPNSLAAVSAGGEVVLEANVMICGKAIAGQWVRTI